jgi:hypothetical protein
LRIGDTIFIFFKIPKPVEVKQVKTFDALEKELKSLFPKCPIYMLDSKYKIINQEDLKRLLEYNFFKDKKWSWDEYDCDNKARDLWSLIPRLAGNIAFGIVYVEKPNGGRHALNMYRDEKNKWFFVEPEDNTVFMVNGADAILLGYKPYKIEI